MPRGGAGPYDNLSDDDEDYGKSKKHRSKRQQPRSRSGSTSGSRRGKGLPRPGHASRSHRSGKSSARAKRDRMLAVAGFEDGENNARTPNNDYTSMNVAQLQQRREEEYALQEAALDNIHAGVIGLKNHGHAINNEVVAQNVMLDELGNEIDVAQEELEKATEKARKVNQKKAKVCKMYCCIIMLFIALITILSI